MKKFLLYFAATVAGLALIVYVSATFFLGSIVKAGVNRIAPKLTQTRVVLDGATISPLTGSGTLTGLSVDNPPGWTEGRAFYLGSIHVAIQPSSFFKDHIVINEITIDGAEFAYETKIISSNINDLLKNIESATGGSKKPEATAANGQPLKFEVRHFRLTNSKVTIGVGITADQLAFAVMRSVTSGVVSATTQAAGQIGTTAGAAAIEGVKKTGEGIKKLFGGGK
jgi:uncharacterized protein involved in outer membrane biogenesis